MGNEGSDKRKYRWYGYGTWELSSSTTNMADPGPIRHMHDDTTLTEIPFLEKRKKKKEKALNGNRSSPDDMKYS